MARSTKSSSPGPDRVAFEKGPGLSLFLGLS